MAKKVIVYKAEWCHWCHTAIAFLEKHKIPFEAKDVEDEANADECMKKSGQGGIPVIDIDGQILVGFDEKKLKELLKIK